MRDVRRSVTTALLLMAGALPVTAQESDWAGWTVSWENDSFAFLSSNRTDDLYTNGVRFVLARNDRRNPAWIDSFGRAWMRSGVFTRNRIPRVTSGLSIGQNFFTPTVITDFDVDPRDRPFGAFSYLGLRVDVTEPFPADWTGNHVRLQHSFEIDVGVMGPLAGADEVQSGVHVLRESRIPKGWDHQIRNEPAVSATYMWRARMGSQYLDVVPHFGAVAGTVQTYGYGGLTARAGINLSDFPALLIRPTAASSSQRRIPAFEIGVLAGIEGRAFVHNAFIDGSLFRDSPSVPSHAFVGDFRYGATVRIVDWRASLTMVRRSPETVENGPHGGEYHGYGLISFGYEPSGRPPGDNGLYDVALPWFFERLTFEAGLGGGRSHVRTGAAVEGPDDGISMRAGATFRIVDQVAIGAEMGGVAREAERPEGPPAPHTDEFLLSTPFTVQVRPFGWRDRKHLVYVRGGIGPAKRKLQVVAPGAGVLDPADCAPGTTLEEDDPRFCSRTDEGTAYVLGAGYAYRLGRQASIGLDVSRYRFDLDDLEVEPRYFATTFTVRYHPEG